MEEIRPKLGIARKYWQAMVIFTFLLTIFAWIFNTPPGILGKADAIGYAVCHRIDLRSFFIGELQMPLCARCSGMYLGAIVGLLFQWSAGKRRIGIPSWKVILPISIFILLFAVDGINSFYNLISQNTGLYPPNNILRLLSGTGMGLAIAVALVPAFNSTIWKMVDPRPALLNVRQFLFMALIAFGVSVLILSEIPVIMYPLALASVAGVVILLTLVYTMVLVMFFKSENQFQQLRQTVLFVLGGLTIALIQIGILDFIRYYLTGTWEGFHL